jgi:hypothetical protein
VFNRSADKDVDTRVLVQASKPAGETLDVNGPSLEATNQEQRKCGGPRAALPPR